MESSSLVLALASHWLEASDVFSASCVSREWRVALSSAQDGSNLWKQVCMNTHPVTTLAAEKVQQNMDYRRLALGLRHIETPSSTRYFTPTLRPENLFVTIELYRMVRVADGKRRRVVQASCACPVIYPQIRMSEKDEKLVVKGVNLYSASMSESVEVQEWLSEQQHCLSVPHHIAFWDLLGRDCRTAFGDGRLKVKVMMFRRDCMKSVCIMDEELSLFPGAYPVSYTHLTLPTTILV